MTRVLLLSLKSSVWLTNSILFPWCSSLFPGCLKAGLPFLKQILRYRGIVFFYFAIFSFHLYHFSGFPMIKGNIELTNRTKKNTSGKFTVTTTRSLCHSAFLSGELPTLGIVFEANSTDKILVWMWLMTDALTFPFFRDCPSSGFPPLWYSLI